MAKKLIGDNLDMNDQDVINANGGARSAKPRTYKLNPAQFKEQVEQLSDTELKRLIEEVQAEKLRRVMESKKVIELFKEEGE